MTTPTYGITFRREADGPRPAQPSDLSVIGLALPADDADAAFLPLNEPVAFDPMPSFATRNTIGMSVGANGFQSVVKGGGTYFSLTAANWKYKVIAQRGW